MDSDRRPSAFQTMLSMFRLSNAPTVPLGEDEVVGDMDEPPDRVPELKLDTGRQSTYSKAVLPSPCVRRESLLTRAIHGGPNTIESTHVPTRTHNIFRALSTASSQSVPSTAELTSDCELTSPARSASPSPPPPTSRFAIPLPQKQSHAPANKVIIAPVTQDDKPAIVEVGEAAVEKTLGRKRCIMFACADRPAAEVPKATAPVVPVVSQPTAEAQPRKSRLTFACPVRQDSMNSVSSMIEKKEAEPVRIRTPSPSVKSPDGHRESLDKSAQVAGHLSVAKPIARKPTPTQAFHEFGSSHDETDQWVDQPTDSDQPKLTLTDVMKKENAIRRIAEEADEEAEEEEREQEDLDNELDDDEEDVEDDFAPSDDEASDGGNESDDEGGFADSDDESDAGSEYQFWAPGVTAPTSIENFAHFSTRQRSRSSSIDSTPSQSSAQRTKIFHPRRASKAKAIRMRPGTPELPDSTDFVCGTLDEDRPLEAAYISCREQRKKERLVLIPQDIDPSFPTTDPEEEEDELDDEAQESEPAWLRYQFGTIDEEDRGRRRPSAIRVAPVNVTPRPKHAQVATVKRIVNKSPAPPRHRSPVPLRHRSPPPRRLFGQSPSRMRSPPPAARLRSPRGSPTHTKMPLGITINRLAQRPATDRTASLPHTPNPFFRNWKRGSPVTSRIPSGAVTPGTDEAVRSDLHVRGPVDIVIGLEKKREKRKDKYWRQHCRKTAKEQAERKPVPGRGVERMKELGLESAERTRGYGLGQQSNLVLSL